MGQKVPHNLGGRNLGCSILDGAERLENGYMLVRRSVLTNWLRIKFKRNSFLVI
jgi:hypothetical protein